MAKFSQFWQITALIAISIVVRSCSALTCNLDQDCLPYGGEFSKCIESECGCEDHYTLVNATKDGEILCMKTGTNGGRCTYDAQCHGAMGHNSKCYPHGPGMCHCLPTSHEGEPVRLYKGKCVVARLLGDPCTNDHECIVGGLLVNSTGDGGGDDGGDDGDHGDHFLFDLFGSNVYADPGVLNEFAVCSSEGVCTCGMDHHVLLHAMDHGGLCMNHCEGCSTVEISVFAIVTLASAGVFVLVVAGYTIINRKR